MGRRVAAELTIDGLLIGLTVWAVFAWPAGQWSPGRTGAENPGIQELRGPETGTIAGEPRRALARDQRSGPKQAALGDAGETPGGTSAESQGDLFMVTATRLNLRSAPDSGSTAIGRYSRGALVEHLSTRGKWMLVRMVDDQRMGWMYGDYLGAAAEN
jgi:hypothetical protein